VDPSYYPEYTASVPWYTKSGTVEAVNPECRIRKKPVIHREF
jgi:hypothetical protein